MIIASVLLISLQLQNSSLVTVGFRVQLASLCPSLSEDEADTVAGDKTKLNRLNRSKSHTESITVSGFGSLAH